MLKTKTIAAVIITILALSGIVASIPGTAEEPYECYYWKLSYEKDLIICNYPGTTDMYHSYLKETDLITAMGGQSYTFSGKHPSGLNYTDWNKTKSVK